MLPSAALRRGLLTGAAVTATLVLSACGGDGGASGSGTEHGNMTPSTGASASTATFNDADVAFAQSMIMHHQEAIEMASMAETRASNAEVKELAGKIEAAQQPEIETMTQWLTSWGQPTAMPSMSSGMPGMESGSMPGSMSAEDMAKLMDAKGAEFDRQFLTMMIAHHEGAIEMAKQEATQGSNPEAKAPAEKIVADQQAEITTMKGLLERL